MRRKRHAGTGEHRLPAMTPALPSSPAASLVAPVSRAWARALARRGAWWWVPLVLSVLFTVSVAIWLELSDRTDLESRQRQLISDSLSLESQISDRVAEEQLQLNALARNFDVAQPPALLARQEAVVDGLARLWQSVSWVDADTRLRALVPEHADTAERPGLSAYLSSALHDAAGKPAGHLVVRYAPAVLLRQTVPWWLAHEYDVRLVDGFGQVIADPLNSGSHEAGPDESHRHSLEPAMPDTYLELSLRESPRPWWLRLPIVLMGVFLSLIGVATALLRWQMNEVLRTQAALRTEAAWRQAMEDSLTVGLRARDADGKLVYVNRAFCDLVGFGPEELVGRSTPMPYWPPDAIADSMSRHLRNLAGGAPRDGYEARWVHADGRPIDVMIFEAPLVDAGGHHIGWMGSILDITERKRLEERERHQTDAVAHQARLTMLGEVASALAHQLNQPLTSITGYAAGVKRLLERAGQPDARLVDAMTRLGDQAAEAGRIVKRIREFLTRRSPQRETMDLGEAAHRALALLARELRRQQLHVEWAVSPGLPPVDADPVLIEQVVLNLVRNACDEMAALPAAQRRLRITIAVAGSSAKPSASDAEGFLRLDVDDSGPGLRGRSVEQLVTPFYSTKPEGMGMGLAICRSIIEAHHGAFDAVAGAFGGARFSFTLPRASALPSSAAIHDGPDALTPEPPADDASLSESEVRP
jgi:two-component system sensor histidine kinase DctS